MWQRLGSEFSVVRFFFAQTSEYGSGYNEVPTYASSHSCMGLAGMTKQKFLGQYVVQHYSICVDSFQINNEHKR